MDNTLLYIIVFLYLIIIFFTTFYCYLGDVCCPFKNNYKLTNGRDDKIYNYEDDVF